MKKITLIVFVLILAVNCFLPIYGYAQITKLHDFTGSRSGNAPMGTLISDGTYLYGMTYFGGNKSSGTIFKMKPNGTGFTNLFDFDGINGRNPYASLYSEGTFLYGMTSQGGSKDVGTIFKIKPDGTGFTKLFDFDSLNGRQPYGSLISDGTFLYGMTETGGTNNMGVVFKIMLDGTGFTKLLDFNGNNGANPDGALVFDGAFLYGMAQKGSGSSANGSVFKIKPDGTGYANILDFVSIQTGDITIQHGSQPLGSLIYDGTFLIGMTTYGGNGGCTAAGLSVGCGTIFKIKPDGTGYTTLYNFNSSTGGNPGGSLISDGTYFYGKTGSGGTHGNGTIFKVKLDGTGYIKLMDVAWSSQSEAGYANGDLYYDGSYLYGMYPWGMGVPAYGDGNIYRIKPDGTGYQSLMNFYKNDETKKTRGDLISDGQFLYGMTAQEGLFNFGNIFKMKLDGTGYTDLFDFNGDNGQYPIGSLNSDSTFFYGMTSGGGTNNHGTIFKIKHDGTGFDTLLNFNGTDGSFPHGSLFSRDSFLYGMTENGGAKDLGVIFKIKKDGTGFAKMFDFDKLNGSNPMGSLISDGTFLYGMTKFGGDTITCGNRGCGVIFKIKLDGTSFDKIMDFNATNGQYPGGSLLSDGTFLFGMAQSGGQNGNGTIFKIKPDKTNFFILKDFITGSTSNGSLIYDGSFLYGLGGGIFKVKTDGTEYSDLIYFNDAVGNYPYGSVISEGNFLYGMTTYGGGNGYGTIFKYAYIKSLPTVTTDSTKSITSSTAMVYGNVTEDGADNYTYSGFCYSTSPNPTLADNEVYGYHSGIGSFSGTIPDLNPKATYYVRAYATNSVGTAYGNQIQFTTGEPVLPTVTTDSITNITSTTAVGYGNITNDGNDPNAVGGFCYNTSPNPTITDNISYSYNNGTGLFSANMYNLIPNTTYYVKAFATNAAGTSYGSQKQFIAGSATLPTETTDSIVDVASTTAKAFGNLVNNGNDPSGTSGFCFSTSINPTIADSTIYSYVYNGTGSFSSSLYNLIPNTIYYIRAYSTNAAGTSYGNQLQFTTGNATLPIVTTDSINNITATTAYAYGNEINNGNDPNASSGFCFNTTLNPTIADNIVTAYVYNGTGPFSSSLYGLNPNTVYYVRAYSTNVKGTTYGSQKQFTTGTATLPVVTTDSIINITANSAYVYGNEINNGNDKNGSSGFCFNTSPNPTVADSISTAYVYGTGSFSAYLYDLKPNTTYYVKAYSTNAKGTSYGSEIQFTTSDCFAFFATTYDTLQNAFTLAVDTVILNNVINYKWDFGDGTASVSPVPSHIYDYNGIYKVSMKIYTLSGDSCEYSRTIGKDNYGYIYRSSGFTLNVIHAASFTAIPEVQIVENNYTIIPNPTSGIVNVVFSKEVNKASLRIISISGQKIIEQHNLTGNKFSFDLSNQASGLYILEVNENGIITRSKLLKE